MNVAIDTQTDLLTGRKTYVIPGNPVPVITPMGPAPGVLRVSTDITGKVTDVRAVLRPRAADVEAIADLLARLATFKLAASDLQGLEGTQPTVTFALKADALAEIGVRVGNAQGLDAFLNEPVLQAGERYVLEDLAASA